MERIIGAPVPQYVEENAPDAASASSAPLSPKGEEGYAQKMSRGATAGPERCVGAGHPAKYAATAASTFSLATFNVPAMYVTLTCQERMSQFMLETFNVPVVYVTILASLSLCAP